MARPAAITWRSRRRVSSGVAGAKTFVRQLAKDARGRQTVTLTGTEPGVGNISMTLSGPGGFTVTRSWNLAVRPAQAVITKQTTKQLAKDEALTYGANLVSEFLPGTAKVTISVSNAPNMGVAALVRALNGYPYGCAEQTTSKALPMLYLASVAESIGIAENNTALRAKVQAAIYRVMTLQSRDGGFGMWTAYDPNASWLTAYVMDFLTRPGRRSISSRNMPSRAASTACSRSSRTATIPGLICRCSPTPIMCWPRTRRPIWASLRYLADNQLNRMPTALARAQLAAALALYGDKERADKALASAQAYKERPRLTGAYWRQSVRDYGSYLRDRSGVLYLTELTRPGSTAVPKLVEEVNRLRTDRRHHSTQEQAWMLLAAHSLMSKGKGYHVVIGQSPSLAESPSQSQSLAESPPQNPCLAESPPQSPCLSESPSQSPSLAESPPQSPTEKEPHVYRDNLQLRIPLIQYQPQTPRPTVTSETLYTVTEEILEENTIQPTIFEELAPGMLDQIINELRQEPDLRDIFTDIEQQFEFEQLGMDIDISEDNTLENELDQW